MRKVGRIALHLGEGWEEVMRLCLLAMGDARGRIRSAETIWRDPETQNEAVRTDAVLKQFQAGVIDLETAQEQLGYSPEQVRQMRARREPAQTPAAPVPRRATPTAGADVTRSRGGRRTERGARQRTSGRAAEQPARPAAEPGAHPGGHDHIGVHDAGPGGRRDHRPATTTTVDVAVLQRELAEARREAAKHRTDLRKVTDAQLSGDRAAAAPGDRARGRARGDRDAGPGAGDPAGGPGGRGRLGFRDPTSRSGSSTRPRSS